ncbi:ankyrin repeat domain-containing protein [Candidatus Dependentiae bacterium]|nr:ankyrin repeat domain-containing protein [Candidatus Dependentiae bacterium]
MAQSLVFLILMIVQLNVLNGLYSEELFHVAESGNVEEAEKLIAQGASVSYVNKQGGTPLGRAVFYEHIPLVKLLLSKGAGCGFRYVNDSLTPLLTAITQKNSILVQLLLEAGADPTSPRYIQGNAPLHWAIRSNCPECVKLLLQAGACPFVQNNAGETALDQLKTVIYEDKQVLSKLLEEYVITIDEIKVKPTEALLYTLIDRGYLKLALQVLQKLAPTVKLVERCNKIAKKRYTKTKEKSYQVLGKHLQQHALRCFLIYILSRLNFTITEQVLGNKRVMFPLSPSESLGEIPKEIVHIIAQYAVPLSS